MQAPTLTRGGRCARTTERLRGCGREGRARRRGGERAPETTTAGIRFLLGQIPDRSPPAGRSPAECPACSVRHCYGAPKGAGGGAEAGLSGRGAGRLEKGRVFMRKRRGQPKGRGLKTRGLRGEESKGGGGGGPARRGVLGVKEPRGEA